MDEVEYYIYEQYLHCCVKVRGLFKRYIYDLN